MPGPSPTDLASARRSETDTAWRRFAAAASPEEFCRSWLDVQCQLVGDVVHATVVLQKPGVETFAPLAYWPEAHRDRAALAEILERTLRDGRGLVEPHGRDFRIAYPVRVDGRLRDRVQGLGRNIDRGGGALLLALDAPRAAQRVGRGPAHEPGDVQLAVLIRVDLDEMGHELLPFVRQDSPPGRSTVDRRRVRL